MQLTVVAPDAHIVNRLDTHEIGFASNVALQIRHELREPPAAVERHAGLFGDLLNAVLLRRVIVTDNRVATNRAGVAAGATHGVLPHSLAKVELGRAGAVANVVEVVRIHRLFGDRHGRIGCAPDGTRISRPTACRRVVLVQRRRIARHDGLRVSPQNAAMLIDKFFPLLGTCRNMHGTVAPNNEGLELFLTHDGADAAGAVRAVDHHVGHRNAVFTCRSDRTNADVRTRFLRKH